MTTYSRAAFDQAAAMVAFCSIDGWTARLAELLDAAHADAIAEDNDRHDDMHTTDMGVCAWCDLTIASTDDLLDQLTYSTNTTLNATIRAELQRRSNADIAFDAESAAHRGLGMIEATVEWLVELFGLTDDELYLANTTDMWSHIMRHANTTN
jgi:hypothetical protein